MTSPWILYIVLSLIFFSVYVFIRYYKIYNENKLHVFSVENFAIKNLKLVSVSLLKPTDYCLEYLQDEYEGKFTYNNQVFKYRVVIKLIDEHLFQRNIYNLQELLIKIGCKRFCRTEVKKINVLQLNIISIETLLLNEDSISLLKSLDDLSVSIFADYQHFNDNFVTMFKVSLRSNLMTVNKSFIVGDVEIIKI